jgi:cytochrome c biogenesis factor
MLCASAVVLLLGMLSPMAFDGCETETGRAAAHCRYSTAVPVMLIFGPLITFVAGTLAVWFRSRGRPRLLMFLPWAITLILLVVVAADLADGKLI